MPHRVVIIGDLEVRPDRKEVLRALHERAPTINWEWIQAEGSGFNVPWKLLAPLLNDLGVAQRDDSISLTVVKLHCLNGRDQDKLHRACSKLTHAPRSLSTQSELIDWLLSPDARLVAAVGPSVSVRAATVLSIFSKLVRKKAWNRNVQGHQWLKEDDLLGQSPVRRSDIPALENEAPELLARGSANLFITKGGKQGRTPKEWCINTQYLPQVKRCLLSRSLRPLAEEQSLSAFVAYVEGGSGDEVVVDDRVVSERALMNCTDREES
jgi:hypothetical protein